MLIGEIKKALDINYKGTTRHIWHACDDCGKERWVQMRKGNPCHSLCHKCSCIRLGNRWKQSNNPHWKGGRKKLHSGYMEIYISPNDPYVSMCHDGKKKSRISEHRYIMAKHLGRCLLDSEQVHHINGIKDDNRVENLELISPANHTLYKRMCSDCELRKEIRLLRWQINELSVQLKCKMEVS